MTNLPDHSMLIADTGVGSSLCDVS